MIKKVLYTLVILSISALILVNFTSCSDDDDSTITGPTGLTLGTFTAKIDGKAFKANTTSAARYSEEEIVVGGVMIESASKSMNISITVSGSGASSDLEGQGFYQRVDLDEATSVAIYPSDDVSYTITKYTDKEISGTFEFTGTLAGGSETVEITDGKFNLAIIE